MTNTVTIPRVEVCRAGTWRSLTGETTITPEDLAATVEASRDPEIDRGRVKLGHISSLNAELGDGEPAFGFLSNPQVSEDGRSLFVDLVDVPRRLAQHIGRAYRQRSVEIRRNVRTPSGKTYRAALTGLALLGAAAPAVKGLADLEAIYAAEADGDHDYTDVVLLSEEDGATRPNLRHTDSDQLDTEQDESGAGPDADTDPKHEEEPTVAFLDQVREKLGLPEEATEEEILAAVEDKNAAQAPEAEGTETGETEAGAEGEAEGETEGEEGEAKLSAKPETVTVSKAVWEDVTGRLTALEKKAAAEHRTKVIDTALSQGKITPAERALWERQMEAAPESTEVLLSDLPSRVNTVESGSVAAGAAGDDDDFDPKAYWDAQGLSDLN